MERKCTGAQRLMCLFVIFMLAFAGMHRDEIPADAALSCADFGTVSLQRVSGTQVAVLFRDNRAVSQLENLNAFRSACRSLSGMQPGHWVTLFLIPILLLLNFLTGERLLPLCEACENQYGRRTLDFIHHKDGKKA